MKNLILLMLLMTVSCQTDSIDPPDPSVCEQGAQVKYLPCNPAVTLIQDVTTWTQGQEVVIDCNHVLPCDQGDHLHQNASGDCYIYVILL